MSYKGCRIYLHMSETPVLQMISMHQPFALALSPERWWISVYYRQTEDMHNGITACQLLGRSSKFQSFKAQRYKSFSQGFTACHIRSILHFFHIQIQIFPFIIIFLGRTVFQVFIIANGIILQETKLFKIIIQSKLYPIFANEGE